MSVDSTDSFGGAIEKPFKSEKLKKSSDRLASGLRLVRDETAPEGVVLQDKERNRVGISTPRYARSAISIADAAVKQVQALEKELSQIATRAREASGEELAKLETEFANNRDEIQRIASSTVFNGVYLLQGQGFKVEGENESVDFKGISLSLDKLSKVTLTKDPSEEAIAAIKSLRNGLEEATNALEGVGEQLKTVEARESIAAENRSASQFRLKDLESAARTAESVGIRITLQSNEAVSAHRITNEKAILDLLK